MTSPSQPADTPDVKAIRERAEKATAGPWIVQTETIKCKPEYDFPDRIVSVLTTEREHPQLRSQVLIFGTSHSPFFEQTVWVCPERGDAEFCAHARQDIPDLLAYVERLERELAVWKPLTPEEAEKALAEAEAVPMSKEEIDRIVKRATDPATVIPNSEQAQLAARNCELETALARVTAENERLHKCIDELTEREVDLHLERDEAVGLLRELDPVTFEKAAAYLSRLDQPQEQQEKSK